VSKISFKIVVSLPLALAWIADANKLVKALVKPTKDILEYKYFPERFSYNGIDYIRSLENLPISSKAFLFSLVSQPLAILFKEVPKLYLP
jgi:hypothetical protein